MAVRFLSVCSGIEAASVALDPLGFEAVGFAEIDNAASRVLAHHYPDVPNYGDFTTIDCSKLGRVDLLCGGTPCQAFSIAGKRGGLDDARGNLTLAFVELAHELAQSHGMRNVFWENVPGVLNSADNAFGRFLGALVGADDALLPSPKPKRGKSNDHWKWVAAGKWPVLDDDGVETGEFVEREEGHFCRWPNVGMVAGPRARLAWRVFDAQYFGLAQRRERVFLVADFGNGADPAEVLFERKSGDWNPEKGRKEREKIARVAQAGAGVGFGGGNRSGPIDAAACLTANGQRIDFEVETFVAQQVAHTLSAARGKACANAADLETYVTHALRGEGFNGSEDGTGRGTPIVSVAYPVECAGTLKSCESGGGQSNSADHAAAGLMIPVAFAIQERAVSENPDAGPQGMGIQEGVAYTLEARHHVQAVAFRTSSNCGAWETGDRTDALTTSTDPNSHVLAFSCKDHGGDATPDLSPTLRAMGHGESHANAGGQMAVAFQTHGSNIECGSDISGTLQTNSDRASGSSPMVAQAFDLRGREGGAQFEGPHDTANIRAASGGSSRSYIAQQWAVRRLTPKECLRLQGFSDGYLDCVAADGPKYKMIGNSWAVPCVSWIGARLAACLI